MARSKYNAKRTTVHGTTFASQREAKRYCELLLLEKAGEIQHLELQPVYPIEVRGALICRYVADFRYREKPLRTGSSGQVVVEDVKGMKTPVYRLKKKLIAALYGIQIREV